MSRLESWYAESGERSLDLWRNLLLCGYVVKLATQPYHPSHGAVFHPTLRTRYDLNITAYRPTYLWVCTPPAPAMTWYLFVTHHSLQTLSNSTLGNYPSQPAISDSSDRCNIYPHLPPVFCQTTFRIPGPYGGVY
jgi:hypothetical protein